MAGSEEALGPAGQRLSSPSAQIAFQDRAGTEPEWISIAQRCLLYTCAGKQHQIQTLPRSGGICPGTLHRARPPRSERLSRQFWDTRDKKKNCPRQKSHSVLYLFCPLPLFPLTIHLLIQCVKWVIRLVFVRLCCSRLCINFSCMRVLEHGFLKILGIELSLMTCKKHKHPVLIKNSVRCNKHI